MNPLERSATQDLEPTSVIRDHSSVSDSAVAAGRPRLRSIGLAILVCLLLGVLFGLVPRWRQRAALRSETRELAIANVRVVSPRPGKAETSLALPAELKPLVEAPIYARASGYVKRWTVDMGAAVTAGQLLAEIDIPEVNQELAQARAQKLQAEAALSLARTTAERWASLLKTASVSEQEAAEKESDLALKSATLEAALANVRRLEDLQAFARVIAPFTGTITARLTDVGELITAGSNRALFRLAQTRTLRVFVHVPQRLARAVTPGQNAEVTVPELPGRRFTAQVVRTSGVISAESRTLLTELELDNAAGELLAGSFAQVRFVEAKSEGALTLPANTLIFHSQGPEVGVVQANGKVELRPVTLGRDLGPTVEILSGVGLDDHVILNPADSLTGGAQVRAANGSGE